MTEIVFGTDFEMLMGSYNVDLVFRQFSLT